MSVVVFRGLRLEAKDSIICRVQYMTSCIVEYLSLHVSFCNARSVILLTAGGYIKRIPVNQFEAQSRGGRGKASIPGGGGGGGGESNAALLMAMSGGSGEEDDVCTYPEEQLSTYTSSCFGS